MHINSRPEPLHTWAQVVQRNLLLADFLDPNHRESLMFHKASKWAREMIGNVRMSCCVAGAAPGFPVGLSSGLLCRKSGVCWLSRKADLHSDLLVRLVL